MDIFTVIIIGVISGWFAGLLSKGGGYGFIGNLVIGIIGSFVGSYIFKFFGVQAGGTCGLIVMSTIGALVFLTLLRLLRGEE